VSHSRREFLVVSTASVALGACAKTKDVARGEAAFTHFEETEAKVMAAWLERLLPGGVPTSTPGATEAGVLRYLDRELSKREFAGYARQIRRVTVLLERTAQDSGALHFYELDPSSQENILTRAQRGELGGRLETQRIFEAVLLLALEGYLGDPKHGGNKDAQVWRSLGETPACPMPAHARHEHR
jgi:gluconate 2-dehydrogenase gamma chain